MPKTLFLLRHAEAVSGHDDHARALTLHGQTQAEALGAELAAAPLALPRLILCSTANRTQQTLTHLQNGGAWHNISARYDDALYNCSATALEAVIAATPQDIAALAIIGHNPSISTYTMHAGLPPLQPANLAIITYDDNVLWALCPNIKPRQATLKS